MPTLRPMLSDPAALARRSDLAVDFLPAEALRLPGRLGLTEAPGRPRGPAPADAEVALRADLARLHLTLGISTLVTLLEAGELSLLGVPRLLEKARAEGLETLWHPVPDFSAPRSMRETVEVVRRVLGRLAQGRGVAIHCRAGLGRTGTLAACCMAGRGWDARAAIGEVRQARPGSVQTPEQEDFVDRFAEEWAGRAVARAEALRPARGG